MPQPHYLKEVRNLCNKFNVLMMLDEIQTGFGRTGKMMAHEWDMEEKPDILIVGKALSGGLMPVSGAFCNDNIMLNIKPGEHGSTYGGNPLAMAVARTAIQTMVDEKMPENAEKMGVVFKEELAKIKNPIICD